MTRRTLWTALIAAAIVAGAGTPVLAQGPGGRPGGGPGGGGRGGPGGGPGGFGGGPGGGFGGGRGGRGNILMMPEVQKELKLDAKQLDKLGKLGANQQRPDPGMNPDARRKAFTEMRRKRDADVAKILNPTQTTRWRQLEIQRAGARALDRDDVAKAIKLTPDQRKKIDAVNDAERDEMRKLFQGMQGGPGGGPGGGGRPGAGGPGGGSGGGRPGAGGPGGGPGGGGEAFSKMRSLREGTDTKLMAVLTPPQKKSFQALQGAPFKFPARRFGGPGGGGPGGGGPGGFGGRGGGGRPDGGRPQGGQPRRPEGAGRA